MQWAERSTLKKPKSEDYIFERKEFDASFYESNENQEENGVLPLYLKVAFL